MKTLRTFLALMPIVAILVAAQVATDKNEVLVKSSELTFTKDIKPIFVKRCSTCHNDGWPDKNWLDYKVVVDNSEILSLRLIKRTMPPPGWLLPDEERLIIIEWIEEGTKK